MAGRLIIEVAQPALDSNGNLINGSTLEFYDAVTLAPKNVFSSAALTTSLGSTVTASGGFFPEIWANDGEAYRVVWKNASGATLRTMDNMIAQNNFNNISAVTYNEAAGALGRVFALDNNGATVTVPASKNFNYIGIRNGGNDNNFTINANALAAGYTFYMRSLAGSSASSNLYGVIGQLNNAGAGSTKAIYGRSTALAGCTGVVMGGVFAVDTVAGLSDAAGVQISLDTTAGGKVNKAVWVNKNAATTVALDYGLLLDDVAIQAGGSGFQMFAKGAGDFLTLKNSTGSANLFSVDSTGAFTTDINIGTTTNGVRVSSSAITRTAEAGNLNVESGLTGQLSLGCGGQYPVVIDQNKINISNPAGKRLNIQGAGSTTVGAAGGAAALPATPLGYFTMQVNGADVKVPYYNV